MGLACGGGGCITSYLRIPPRPGLSHLKGHCENRLIILLSAISKTLNRRKSNRNGPIFGKLNTSNYLLGGEANGGGVLKFNLNSLSKNIRCNGELLSLQKFVNTKLQL